LLHEQAVEPGHADPAGRGGDRRYGEVSGQRLQALAQVGTGERALAVERAVVQRGQDAGALDGALVGSVPSAKGDRAHPRGGGSHGDEGAQQGDDERPQAGSVKRRHARVFGARRGRRRTRVSSMDR
jgi:hypothetical protein